MKSFNNVACDIVIDHVACESVSCSSYFMFDEIHVLNMVTPDVWSML